MDEMRDCENCKNYKDTGEGYSACCKWNCEFEPDTEIKETEGGTNDTTGI